jgi:hypothetical protein
MQELPKYRVIIRYPDGMIKKEHQRILAETLENEGMDR